MLWKPGFSLPCHMWSLW